MGAAGGAGWCEKTQMRAPPPPLGDFFLYGGRGLNFLATLSPVGWPFLHVGAFNSLFVFMWGAFLGLPPPYQYFCGRPWFQGMLKSGSRVMLNLLCFGLYFVSKNINFVMYNYCRPML